MSIALIATAGSHAQTPGPLKASLDTAGDRIQVYRHGVEQPIATQVARADFRPYLHPIEAPDGRGYLTEFSPAHHRHQTGLYWGFTRVNGRDYFHHPEGTHWKRVAVSLLKSEAKSATEGVQWQTVYDLLDEQGQAVMRESQIWTFRDEGTRYVMDLHWTGEAFVDITVGMYDYGGLFLRMPWKKGLAGNVVNNARQRDERAEGQRGVWLDVGLQIEGRDDMAHVAILDHPQNRGFPTAWRVDSQLGVGPARTREGDWKLAKGHKEFISHRLIAYTGSLNDVTISREWSEYTGQKMEYVQWQLAQQAGRKAEFLTPEKAVERMSLVDGFQVNVFAAEPMIAQPMAFSWDARGRLWIAENRDYETRQTGFSNDGSSRIIILEDQDRDGVAESRKVFLEDIPFPSAMATGVGGLWLGAPPNLLFVPDRDGDDRADREAIEVRLTGWGIRDRHETLNSLTWGPDGWLYGLQGFATPSRVGKPKDRGRLYRPHEPFPEHFDYADQPVDINGGVWRYHPFKDRFEVVAHGFSNPWGIDYDKHGQLFITACVIPHLWHVIPGGIYHRQGGSHFSPYIYDDIKTIADHKHQSAHGGARVYQSDAFPTTYRDRIFMANLHEHAVLSDILEPKGSGFIGRHGDDFLLANNEQWVGFSVEVGPEGALYILDWHDADICGKEVLHKETGRVFRVVPTNSQANHFEHRFADLGRLDDLALARLQLVPSAWHAQQARNILQHRAQQKPIAADAQSLLLTTLRSDSTVDLRLRALWTLHATRNLTTEILVKVLHDDEAYLRGWAIQLLCEDGEPPVEATSKFLELADTDPSPVVRLYLAAATQRLPVDLRWRLLEKLAFHAEDQQDHNLPRLEWFSLEPLVLKDVPRALTLAGTSKIPMLTRFIARRLADAEAYNPLLEKLTASDEAIQLPLLLGIRDALEGRFDVKPPSGWAKLYPRLTDAGGEIAKVALQVSRQFGDTLAAEEMLATLRNQQARPEDRRQAIQALAGLKRAELKSELLVLWDDPNLRREAIRAVGAFDEPTLARGLLQRFPQLNSEERLEVVQTLATRSSYGNELTKAIQQGKVAKSDVPAHVARLLRRVVGPFFVDVWGKIDELEADKEGLFTKYRTLLHEQALKEADLSQGRAIYRRSCAACHQLHGDGGTVGPDITGANRSNLEYLLSNILTPSAIIQDAYRMHLILTDDGRLFSGIPMEETERHLKIRVADRPEPVTIPKAEIESREIAAVSMMPEGILSHLKDSEVIDLIAYLQSIRQVDLPSPTPSLSPTSPPR